MRFKAHFLLATMVAAGASSSASTRAVRECPPLASDPIGMSVDDVVDQSSAVVLATVGDFATTTQLPSYLSYYDLEINRVLKGEATIGPVRVVGFKPYETIPQHYLDATERHARQGERYRSIEFNKVKIEGDCRLAFKGLPSYTYLLFFKDGALWSFDVINDREHDQLLLHVENAAE